MMNHLHKSNTSMEVKAFVNVSFHHTKGVHRVCCFTEDQTRSTAAIYWPRTTAGQQNEWEERQSEQLSVTQQQPCKDRGKAASQIKTALRSGEM